MRVRLKSGAVPTIDSANIVPEQIEKSLSNHERRKVFCWHIFYDTHTHIASVFLVYMCYATHFR
jgi:hypothetical protein